MKDASGYAAMDYATQRGLHYCALLLSQSNGFDETDKCVLAIQTNYIQLPIDRLHFIYISYSVVVFINVL